MLKAQDKSVEMASSPVIPQSSGGAALQDLPEEVSGKVLSDQALQSAGIGRQLPEDPVRMSARFNSSNVSVNTLALQSEPNADQMLSDQDVDVYGQDRRLNEAQSGEKGYFSNSGIISETVMAKIVPSEYGPKNAAIEKKHEFYVSDTFESEFQDIVPDSREAYDLQTLQGMNSKEAPEIKRFQVEKKEIIHEVTENIAPNIKFGAKKAVLHLNPPELGRIRVQMSLSQDNHLSVTFYTEHSEVRRFLDGQMDSLRANLEQKGFNPNQLVVDPSNLGESVFLGDRGQQNAQRWADENRSYSQPTLTKQDEETYVLTEPHQQGNGHISIII